jgi:hypothetical protein
MIMTYHDDKSSCQPLQSDSDDTIKRIKAFIRHEKNSEVAPEFKDTPWRDAGFIAWLLWGGAAAIKDWAPRIVAKYEREE